MRNGGFTGWAAALLLALLSGFLLIRLQERTTELASLRAEMGRLQAAAQETAQSLESLRATVDQIQKQAAPPAATAAPAPPPAGAATDSAGTPAPDDKPSIATLISSLGTDKAGLDSETDATGGSRSTKPHMKTFGGKDSEAMIAEIAEMTMENMYDPWVDEMAFPPEVEARVRAVFVEHKKALMRSGKDYLGGDFAGMVELPTDETLRQQLAEILGPDAMAAYDTYMAELPERMAEEAVDMQLMTQARGLSPEGSELFKAALVEEQLASEQGVSAVVQGEDDVSAFMEAYAGAYDRALERSREGLSERDLRILERFVERNRRMYEAFQGVTVSDDAPKPE